MIKALFGHFDKTNSKSGDFDLTSFSIAAGFPMILDYSIIEAPGYGDMDSSDTFDAIEHYVDEKLDQYFESEFLISRANESDSRVHACLYLLPHTGHGVKKRDLALMRRLHRLVRLVPVIAKSDTCTSEELQTFKQQVLFVRYSF